MTDRAGGGASSCPFGEPSPDDENQGKDHDCGGRNISEARVEGRRIGRRQARIQHALDAETKPGEPVLLRVTAHRGKSWNRDGSIHGFTLLRARDRTKVEGWDLLFKPGKQEFLLTAPSEPGQYEVVCTVICSEEHEGMHMKFTVVP